MENNEIKLAAERAYPIDKSLREAFEKGGEYQRNLLKTKSDDTKITEKWLLDNGFVLSYYCIGESENYEYDIDEYRLLWKKEEKPNNPHNRIMLTIYNHDNKQTVVIEKEQNSKCNYITVGELKQLCELIKLKYPF